MRVMMINTAGDVREAHRRLESGGRETYHAQRYSLESYARMTDHADDVAIMTLQTEERYRETLPNGVTTIGCGCSSLDRSQVIAHVEEHDPSHIVVGFIDPRLLTWLAWKRIQTLAMFPSSLPQTAARPVDRAKQELRNRLVAACLNRPTFGWVGSYGLNSARVLSRVGVDREKIVPWDLLLDSDPGELGPKTGLPEDGAPTLCYVGSLAPEKGVGDLVHAVARLRQRGFDVQARLVGDDRSGYARELIERLGQSDRVELLGTIPNERVEPLMNEHDVVVVPSHHTYPEGFPLVIHHALRACTPIVASDHPMFEGHLEDGITASLFPAGDPDALASCLSRLLTDEERYRRISEASHATWRRLRLDTKWYDLVQRWLRGTPEDREWLRTRSLAALEEPPKPRPVSSTRP